MKILVAFSGGKDSHASLILTVKKWGAKNVTAVFCDTQWEHALLYPFIEEVCKDLGCHLIILKSEYSFIQLAEKKNRFPSTKAKFCSEILKVNPMIDYVLTELQSNDYLLIIQGIRRAESNQRSTAEENCQYFKYYFTPYGHDKNGKPKYFTYRKKDIIKLSALEKVDIERPVINLSAQEVIKTIIDYGHKPNPLYYAGLSRVGCFPCIMCKHKEVFILIDKFPEYAKRLIDAEVKLGGSFFPPNYIPKRFHDKNDKGKTFASAKSVFEYIKMKNASGKLYEEEESQRSCMTAFNVCE